MYTFRRCIGAYQGDLVGLQLLDITTAKLSSVMELTRLCFITVYDHLLLRESTIDMDVYRNEALYFDGTIQQWLDTKESLPLIPYDGVIGEDFHYVRMEDLQIAGYQILPGRYDLAAGRQSSLTVAGGKDILVRHLTATNVKYADFVETTLFTYNGYFHQAQGRPDGLYLMGAGKNFQVDDTGHVGALDFNSISKVNTQSFTKDQLDIDAKRHQVTITVDHDILQETVWFVIAGKLICNPSAITKIGPNLIRLDLRALDLGRLLIQGAKHIDLDNIANCTSGVVEAGLLERSGTIEQLLTNFNSFMVFLSNPYLGVSVEPLERYTFPTTFATEDVFHHPVMTSDGRFPTYRHREGAGRRLLDLDHRLIDVPIDYSTGPDNGGDLYHDAVNWSHPHTLIEAYHFKIFSIFKGM